MLYLLISHGSAGDAMDDENTIIGYGSEHLPDAVSAGGFDGAESAPELDGAVPYSPEELEGLRHSFARFVEGNSELVSRYSEIMDIHGRISARPTTECVHELMTYISICMEGGIPLDVDTVRRYRESFSQESDHSRHPDMPQDAQYTLVSQLLEQYVAIEDDSARSERGKLIARDIIDIWFPLLHGKHRDVNPVVRRPAQLLDSFSADSFWRETGDDLISCSLQEVLTAFCKDKYGFVRNERKGHRPVVEVFLNQVKEQELLALVDDAIAGEPDEGFSEEMKGYIREVFSGLQDPGKDKVRCSIRIEPGSKVYLFLYPPDAWSPSMYGRIAHDTVVDYLDSGEAQGIQNFIEEGTGSGWLITTILASLRGQSMKEVNIMAGELYTPSAATKLALLQAKRVGIDVNYEKRDFGIKPPLDHRKKTVVVVNPPSSLADRTSDKPEEPDFDANTDGGDQYGLGATFKVLESYQEFEDVTVLSTANGSMGREGFATLCLHAWELGYDVSIESNALVHNSVFGNADFSLEAQTEHARRWQRESEFEKTDLYSRYLEGRKKQMERSKKEQKKEDDLPILPLPVYFPWLDLVIEGTTAMRPEATVLIDLRELSPDTQAGILTHPMGEFGPSPTHVVNGERRLLRYYVRAPRQGVGRAISAAGLNSCRGNASNSTLTGIQMFSDSLPMNSDSEDAMASLAAIRESVGDSEQASQSEAADYYEIMQIHPAQVSEMLWVLKFTKKKQAERD